MTPYELEHSIRTAQVAVREDNRQMLNVVFSMLCTLLQHEADKEANRNIERANGER